MSAQTTEAPRRSHAYDLFILVLTLLSLGIMVLLVLPTSVATTHLLTVYDNVVCVVFLGDFALRIVRADSRRRYFIYERGWLDLLGSIPSLGFFQYTALLRLARLSRLARISRLLTGENRQRLVNDLVRNRSQYAVFITVMSGFTVLVIASILILQVESHSRDANIKTGGQAFWWGIVTITTVGYGDFYPVTTAGRIIAAFVMFAGVGIIGSLASILASILVPSPKEQADAVAAEAAAVPPTSLGSEESGGREELAAIREELVAIRRSLVSLAGEAAAD